MKRPQYEDQVRARGFGTVAELYDRARPTYPAQLVDDLLSAGPGDIVDVGCGTGKAGRLFVGGGRRVCGVEPDARMAAVARRYGIDVDVAAFETWDSAGRRFDLLICGQAWHWVDPVAGAAKAAEVLRSGGRFAAFWNEMHHGAPVRAVFDRVYRRRAPGLLATSVALGVIDPADVDHDPAAEALAANQFAVAPDRRRYRRDAEYTPRQWIDLVATYSDHRLLDAATRSALLAELEDGLATLGPRFAVSLQTHLLTATRH